MSNHRRPVKSLPTAAEYRKERREKYLADVKERRQAQIEEVRHPHRGHEYYYVVHGHGGIPFAFRNRTFPLVDVNVIFYCHDGQTTQQLAQHGVNAAWPKILNRLRIGNTLPTDFVAETITRGRACQTLFLFPGHGEIPEAGLYFVCRQQPGVPPHICEKLCELNEMTFLLSWITKRIQPDSSARGLDRPINIHFVACREHMNA